MKANHILIIISIILIIIIIFISKPNHLPSPNNNKNISEVCFKENCFSVEIAKTNEERQKGLMFRESLGKDKGMLFIYDAQSKQSFWMKNTLISLDIIWINKNFKIVHIITAQPCKNDPCQIYSPDEEALYILEINAGLTNELKIKEGNQVEIIRAKFVTA